MSPKKLIHHLCLENKPEVAMIINIGIHPLLCLSSLLLIWFKGWSLNTIIHVIMMLVLIMMSYVDLNTEIINDRFIATMIVAALMIYQPLSAGHIILFSCLCLASLSGIWGWGDAKLCLGFMLSMSFQDMLLLLTWAALFCLIIMISLKKRSLCFGPFLTLSFFLYCLGFFDLFESLLIL